MKGLSSFRSLACAAVWVALVAAARPGFPAPSPEPSLGAAPDAALTAALAAHEALFLAIRESAANLKLFYEQNCLAGDGPGQRRLLDRLADPEHLPAANELEDLFASLRTQLDALGRVSTFRAPVYAPDGRMAEREVLRLGGFSLLADGHYLVYAPEVGRLVELARQPSSALVDLARRFAQADAKSLAPVAIDPSGGQTLQLLVQIPELRERIAQGGAVGYLILALAVFALFLSGYRFAELSLVGQRIRRQLESFEARPDNPLGRVLARLEQTKTDDEEALYLTVEEALAGERMRLERALGLLKLVAAIAPMLGLLGTVTGMIKTFQAIALHGSGDPKLMSGGISEALVTTVEGLVTAIPVLLLHSLLAGKSQALGTMLEAHAAAALSGRLERRQTASRGNGAVPAAGGPQTPDR
ncbi:MotA/TolQ/ExbB proton channel family protein [Methylococcus sp. ANG]|uniref:MotA/TolQ/ExbB proton channel family protein n=1 Tax=unclassified Methylococcus TaxID=2618889 RepID=UPI001C527B7A|nr:MotA/TolQ/ExbB proton channel family protein [Methylococcus sp. Mc7]QXP82619.1 MotA/TolQ/ExbB proton channel family protein [Methylococcus sp. Mc7]